MSEKQNDQLECILVLRMRKSEGAQGWISEYYVKGKKSDSTVSRLFQHPGNYFSYHLSNPTPFSTLPLVVHSLKHPLFLSVQSFPPCLQVKILIYYLDITGPFLSVSSIKPFIVAHKLTFKLVFYCTTLYPPSVNVLLF